MSYVPKKHALVMDAAITVFIIGQCVVQLSWPCDPLQTYFSDLSCAWPQDLRLGLVSVLSGPALKVVE